MFVLIPLFETVAKVNLQPTRLKSAETPLLFIVFPCKALSPAARHHGQAAEGCLQPLRGNEEGRGSQKGAGKEAGMIRNFNLKPNYNTKTDVFHPCNSNYFT